MSFKKTSEMLYNFKIKIVFAATQTASLFLIAVVFICVSQTYCVAQAQNSMGVGIVAKVENASGRHLTDAQKNAIRKQSLKTREKLREQQDIFIHGVSQIFQLPEETVRGYLPKVGESNEGFDKNMIPKVEKDLKRSITMEEREKLGRVDQNKKTAVGPIQDELAKVIADESGLSIDQAKGLLPKVGL